MFALTLEALEIRLSKPGPTAREDGPNGLLNANKLRETLKQVWPRGGPRSRGVGVSPETGQPQVALPLTVSASLR